MKKVIAAALALVLCLQLAGCGTPQKESGTKKETSSSSAVKTTSVTLQALTYRVPSTWRKVKAESGYYHYPTDDNKAGFLFVSYNEIDFSSVSSTEDLHEVYSTFFKGVQGDSKDFKLGKKEFIKLAGIEAFKASYSDRVDTYGMYNMELYVLADVPNNALYYVTFTMRDKLQKEIGAQIDTVVGSLRLDKKATEAGGSSSGSSTAGSDGQTGSTSSSAAGSGSAAGSAGGQIAGGQNAGGSGQAGAGTNTSPNTSSNSGTNTGPSGGETQSSEPSGVTAGQANALSRARAYLGVSAFSHDGLVRQLEYEQFSHEEAVYGADNCGADWNAQALKKAGAYLNTSAFSYQGLIRQLEYEQFTSEQAAYGANNCGADWNEQAAKKAQTYMNFSSFSRQGLIDQLKYEGFTDEQAAYGASAVGL